VGLCFSAVTKKAKDLWTCIAVLDVCNRNVFSVDEVFSLYNHSQFVVVPSLCSIYELSAFL
jgi:hypothetical protein